MSLVSMIKKNITYATACTFLRVILVPFILCYITQEQWYKAFVFFCFAACTDFFDGMIARYYKEQTVFGALFDPVADKILVLTTLITLCVSGTIVYQDSLCNFCFFVVIKDIIIAVGTLYLYFYNKIKIVKPTLLGKSASLLQMVFVAVVLATQAFFNSIKYNLFFILIGILYFFISAVLFQYFYIGLRYLLSTTNNKSMA